MFLLFLILLCGTIMQGRRFEEPPDPPYATALVSTQGQTKQAVAVGTCECDVVMCILHCA